jgi:hypothetical protein
MDNPDALVTLELTYEMQCALWRRQRLYRMFQSYALRSWSVGSRGFVELRACRLAEIEAAARELEMGLDEG